MIEVPNKLQLYYKIGGETQEYSYVEGNRTRAFLLKLLASPIRLLLTQRASKPHTRNVCATVNKITVNFCLIEKLVCFCSFEHFTVKTKQFIMGTIVTLIIMSIKGRLSLACSEQQTLYLIPPSERQDGARMFWRTFKKF